jgi:hypothetical protein
MGIATWTSRSADRIIGGFTAKLQDTMLLIGMDARTRPIELRDVPKRSRTSGGKTVVPRKAAGQLENLVPVRITSRPKRKKRKSPARTKRKPVKKKAAVRRKTGGKSAKKKVTKRKAKKRKRRKS